jgi:hypothetical protein
MVRADGPGANAEECQWVAYEEVEGSRRGVERSDSTQNIADLREEVRHTLRLLLHESSIQYASQKDSVGISSKSQKIGAVSLRKLRSLQTWLRTSLRGILPFTTIPAWEGGEPRISEGFPSIIEGRIHDRNNR